MDIANVIFILLCLTLLNLLVLGANHIKLQSHCCWKTFSLPIARKSFDVYEAFDADIFFDDAITHLAVADDVTEPYGVVSWSSSKIISTLLDEHPFLVKNLRVCDLGCGTGIASLVAATLDASEVIALDHNPWALEIANVSFTKLNNQLKKDVIRSERFDMNDVSSMLPVCDVLLMSDLLYFPDLAMLCATRVVEALLSEADVVVTDPGRNTVPIFLEELKRLLVLQQVPKLFVKNKSSSSSSTSSLNDIKAIHFQPMVIAKDNDHGTYEGHQYLWLSTKE